MRSPTASSKTLAISGLFLSQPASGTGLYTGHIVEYLAAHAPEHALNVAIPNTAGIEQTTRHGPYLAHWQAVGTPWHGRGGDNLDKIWWEQVTLARYTRRVGASVLYSPHFSLPLIAPCRTVVTIHDLVPLIVPEYRGSPPIQAYFRLVSAAARRATAIITVSQHARADIVRLLGISAHRIHAFYEGVEERFQPGISADELARVRHTYDLPERYFLYVGGNDARKNISVLLKAAALLAQQPTDATANPDNVLPPLVVVARERAAYSPLFPNLRGEAATLGLQPSQIRFVDFVADADLPGLYAGASLFLFPSLYEGFGLTPLEAMSCGAPVVCANCTSLPEIVGDAGCLLDPAEPEVWAATILALWNDPARRAQMRVQGLERASQFQWETLGRNVLDLLQRIASGEHLQATDSQEVRTR